jgi:3(or 17)beta-hydroxysteroid dehydrogenase
MAERLAGKVAIVTGGASGIGAETSRCLAAEGARVIVADLDEALGGKVASEIGSNAAFVRHDVADEASWESIVAETLREHGGLHVLVNNAGILFRGDVEETPLEDWRRVQAVNADGVFLGCKHAIPAMRASGPASIVNVSSLAALRGTPVYAAYSASKGAVRSLSKTVALHCAARGDAIRCNSIHPGGVSTPMVRLDEAERGRDRRRGDSPLGGSRPLDGPGTAARHRQPDGLPRLGRVDLRERGRDRDRRGPGCQHGHQPAIRAGVSSPSARLRGPC